MSDRRLDTQREVDVVLGRASEQPPNPLGETVVRMSHGGVWFKWRTIAQVVAVILGGTGAGVGGVRLLESTMQPEQPPIVTQAWKDGVDARQRAFERWLARVDRRLIAQSLEVSQLRLAEAEREERRNVPGAADRANRLRATVAQLAAELLQVPATDDQPHPYARTP